MNRVKKVDTTGLKCPEPLIMTKKALKETGEGETILVMTDNDTSLENLKRFLSDNSVSFSVDSSSGVYTLTITRGGEDISSAKPDDYCEVTINSPSKRSDNYVVVFSSEHMGEGNEDLGLMLIKSFVTTLLESDKLPAEIVFYNSGVRLATNDSFVIEGLRELEKKGVKLLLCGTCVNFYNLKQDISIGIISNMYEIAEKLTGSSKIVKP